jgi:hypothetical protein
MYGSWEGRPPGKMQYIHNELKALEEANKLTEFSKKIYDKYGAEIFRRSTIPIDRGDIVIEKCMNKEPRVKTALEIGTWNGIPAACLAQYCDKVVTIDIEDQDDKYGLWDYLGISDKIDFHLVKNESEKEELISSLDFDFCYMDGAHASYTYSDWMMVRGCGRVIFHEYWTKQKPVWQLVNSLPKKEIKKFQNINGKCTSFAYWEKK